VSHVADVAAVAAAAAGAAAPCCEISAAATKVRNNDLNDTSAQLRKELAIWLLILERFAVS